MLGIVLGFVTSSGSSTPPTSDSHPSRATPAGAPSLVAPPAAAARLLPWSLQAAISREAVLNPGGGSLLLAGGLVGSTSESGVFRLAPTSGALTQLGSLPVATHDAAGIEVAGRSVLVGGGTAVPAATVQSFAGGAGTQAAPLGAPRADATGVSIGGIGYVVGGYDGPSYDPGVLATSDGQHFRIVASLAVPVRYPAAASVGGKIFVFGGATLTGSPVSTIQEVDLETRSSTVVGRLPVGLAGASAASFGKVILLAGGEGDAGTSSTIYAYVPASGKLLVAGKLPVPVAYAGSAVSDGRLFLIGGEQNGARQLASAEVVSPVTKPAGNSARR